MKFQFVINMERKSADESMPQLIRDTLELVQMAEAGGFHIVWAAEHHTLEFTIAPNPFQILTWFAAHTSRIRLGTATVVAPYWSPIRAAGEAALCDLYSNGRLEFGIGSGAYQYEFDRMAPGVNQSDGYKYAQELLPAVKALWQGDYEHNGDIWKFPLATSVPKPLQTPHPPIWMAARAPITYDYAIKNGCNIQSWALTRPFSEVETYKQRFEQALADNPGCARPIFATMRHCAVYENENDADAYLDCTMERLAKFENLFRNVGGVEEGFPEHVDVQAFEDRQDFDRPALLENLMFGTPDRVIDKLHRYKELGVDQFIYNASYGLPMELQKRSLKLFIDKVMPAFS
ncbi:MAG: LLM class flavin-dependent oxidoreductase [Pseudomonadota bacterium]